MSVAMAFAIQLSDEQTRALAETARRLNVPQEDLAAAAIRDLLNRPSPDFEAIAARVLSKNGELYRRLA